MHAFHNKEHIRAKDKHLSTALSMGNMNFVPFPLTIYKPPRKPDAFGRQLHGWLPQPGENVRKSH